MTGFVTRGILTSESSLKYDNHISSKKTKILNTFTVWTNFKISQITSSEPTFTLFIGLYEVVITCESVDEILGSDRSIESC